MSDTSDASDLSDMADTGPSGDARATGETHAPSDTAFAGVPAFDLAGPLPKGVQVLEASAGTGKTYTIAGLVARYVAEGYGLAELLVVTFTRAATSELRERVRARLVAVAAELERWLDAQEGAEAGRERGVAMTITSEEPAVQALRAGGPETWRVAHRRLTTALSEFDAATITTIHGFCQSVLGGVGLAGDTALDAHLVEDQRELIQAVVDDVLVRRFHASATSPPLTRAQLTEIVDKVVGNPDALAVPTDPSEPDTILHVELVEQIRDELERRKRAGRWLSYDDLLTRLRATLAAPTRGRAVRERLRRQYRVALIDEFQDTDPVQWEIFEQLFGEGPGDLVLIGDPKQAIYGFRGADVFAYLRAAARADRSTLRTNFRSDGPLLRAYATLLGGAQLGHREILFRPVRPAPGHETSRLVDPVTDAPVRLRVVPRHPDLPLSYGRLQVEPARALVARDVAAETVRLLGAGTQRVEGRSAARQAVPVRPGDIAVLVRTHAEAGLVHTRLREAGVPAVVNGVGSVFKTVAATEWQRLLEALERPSSAARARSVALTAFLGWSPGRAAQADDRAWQEMHEGLQRWSGVLRERSVAALYRAIVSEQRLPQRLLGFEGGERMLTDLEHIGELLHAASVADELGATALPGWLRTRIDQADDDIEPDERARRLDSDAEAVQVITVHRSKGLEFPIVLAPFLWTSTQPVRVPVFHDDSEDGTGRRLVHVGGKESEDYTDHQRTAKREQDGEALRLLYVALTRAQHQSVIWWAPGSSSPYSPLGRLLFCRRASGAAMTICAQAGVPKTDEAGMEALEAIAARSDGTIVVETVPAAPVADCYEPRPSSAETLRTAVFDRGLDRHWRRTSYSALTARAHASHGTAETQLVAETDETASDDEAALEGQAAALTPVDLTEAALRDRSLPLGDQPGGVRFGTFVHRVLEDLDFAAADLDAALDERIDHEQARRRIELDSGQVRDGLRLALETPLGPLANELPLRAVTRADRRDELDFELPLAVGGGSQGPGALSVAGIGALLAAHLPADDPLVDYPARLGDPVFSQRVRGYLTGSIDLVLRVPATQRYAVVDYKTNRLGQFGEPLTAWDYRPAALSEAMQQGDYPLQALLYQVALHRYLRWRLPGYDPAHNLAGALYLFLRGMGGPQVPRVDSQPCGVFSWRPPADLIVALSELLDAGEVAA